MGKSKIKMSLEQSRVSSFSRRTLAILPGCEGTDTNLWGGGGGLEGSGF